MYLRLFLLPILLFSLLAALSGCSDSSSSSVIAAAPAISTVEGVLTGGQEGGSFAYKGIPYAAPPVGAARWKPPAPVTPWAGSLNATALKSPCSQPQVSTAEAASDSPDMAIGSEDCLYLNVWTPTTATSGSSLPVMFFIHGGANLFGSSSVSIDFILNTTGGPTWYDGSRLAANGDVVIVTLNYRLGALGFLAHSGMLSESETGSVGNYGIMDQIAALKWVQRNITSFGGDPDRVMIFGQSAGAFDICTLVASSRTAGLFSRALMQSGSCSIHSADKAQTNAEAIVAEVGCDSVTDLMSCLRSVPAKTFALATSAQPLAIGSFTMFPSVDGYIVSDNPINIIRNGAHNHVPFAVGSNSEEYATRVNNISALDYPSIISDLVGPADRDLILSHYPLNDYDTASDAVAAVLADRNITCPAGWYAGVMASVQTEPVYRYFFSRTLSSNLRLADGAYHSSELLFVFQHMSGSGFDANEDDRAVESNVRNYWTRFAANGNPNGGDAPFWPAYENLTKSHLNIDVAPFIDNRLHGDKCDMWATLL